VYKRQAWNEQVEQKFTEPVEVTLMYTPDETIIHVTTSPHSAKTLRGDLDNYVKLTLDALNGIAWDDDNQVVRINAVKVDRRDIN
jgi:Holliday junction resolvase RusA-like endonuclease